MFDGRTCQLVPSAGYQIINKSYTSASSFKSSVLVALCSVTTSCFLASDWLFVGGIRYSSVTNTSGGSKLNLASGFFFYKKER